MADHTYAIYREYADDPSNEQVYLGDMQAETMSDALDLATQYYEYPQHDLVAVLVDEATLQKCPYCQQWHEAGTIEQCQLKP